ncbi:hypothetical protein Tco_0449201 [Tanacetum coccineum]
MDNKLGEAINKAIQAHNLDCRQEAQDEKNAYIELVDTSMRAIIKEEVNTQLPQILPKAVSYFANLVIEKNVTKSVEAAVLTRSSSRQFLSVFGHLSSFSEISSMGSEIMASCEDCLDGEGEVKVESMGGGVVLGVGQGEVKGGGVDFGVINSLLGEILGEVMGEME